MQQLLTLAKVRQNLSSALAFQLTMFKTTKDGVLGKTVETGIPSWYVWFTPGFRNATAGMMRKVAILMANKSTYHHVC